MTEPSKPAMTTGTRTTLAVVLGFILYRICVEFMEPPPALLLGVLAGGATWALTSLWRRPS